MFQVVPNDWTEGAQYSLTAAAFTVAEIVVVTRTNGSMTFAKVESVDAKKGTVDVSLDMGDAKNASSKSVKSGLIPGAGLLGKIIPNPEGSRVFEEEEDDSALTKYSTDLVRLAREGKLDPVVGRDEEISRVVGRTHARARTHRAAQTQAQARRRHTDTQTHRRRHRRDGQDRTEGRTD